MKSTEKNAYKGRFNLEKDNNSWYNSCAKTEKFRRKTKNSNKYGCSDN